MPVILGAGDSAGPDKDIPSRPARGAAEGIGIHKVINKSYTTVESAVYAEKYFVDLTSMCTKV